MTPAARYVSISPFLSLHTSCITTNSTPLFRSREGGGWAHQFDNRCCSSISGESNETASLALALVVVVLLTLAALVAVFLITFVFGKGLWASSRIIFSDIETNKKSHDWFRAWSELTHFGRCLGGPKNGLPKAIWTTIWEVETTFGKSHLGFLEVNADHDFAFGKSFLGNWPPKTSQNLPSPYSMGGLGRFSKPPKNFFGPRFVRFGKWFGSFLVFFLKTSQEFLPNGQFGPRP